MALGERFSAVVTLPLSFISLSPFKTEKVSLNHEGPVMTERKFETTEALAILAGCSMDQL